MIFERKYYLQHCPFEIHGLFLNYQKGNFFNRTFFWHANNNIPPNPPKENNYILINLRQDAKSAVI
jgi:hypothetical protein